MCYISVSAWGRLGGGLGRLGEAWGRLGECLGNCLGRLGRLGEACPIHARPLWGSSGGLGEAWGMLGNALGRLGRGWGRLGEAPYEAPSSHLYIHTCMHTHIHTYIHTYWCMMRAWKGVDRTSLSCAWQEAPHKEIYNQGGSPQISRTMYHHTHTYIHTYIHRVPTINPIETQDLPTSIITLRPGRLPTRAIIRFL